MRGEERKRGFMSGDSERERKKEDYCIGSKNEEEV